jgi:hypothetical protein
MGSQGCPSGRRGGAPPSQCACCTRSSTDKRLRIWSGIISQSESKFGLKNKAGYIKPKDEYRFTDFQVDEIHVSPLEVHGKRYQFSDQLMHRVAIHLAP